MEAAQNALPRFDLTLQHNEVMDPFVDDWKALAVEETTFGSKADSYLLEYQSFTDLKNSKNKTVTAVDWHPSAKGESSRPARPALASRLAHVCCVCTRYRGRVVRRAVHL